MKITAKIPYLLILLVFCSFKTAEIVAMEEERKIEAEIIMPSAPSEKILPTFNEADIPEASGIAGNVQLVSGDEKQTETVPVSAAEISEILKDLILEVGTDQPFPVQVTGNLFTKLVESLKALNTITATEPSEYSNAMVKALEPVLSRMSFDQMLELLMESNRLNIKPLNWYITALFAAELEQNNNLSVLRTLIKALAVHKDIETLIVQMLKPLLSGGGIFWKFFIPLGYLYMEVKTVPHKGIIALTETAKNLYLWNLTKSSSEVQKELEASIGRIASLTISKDGTKALGLTFNGDLQLWDLGSGAVMKQKLGEKGNIRLHVALSPDDKYVLSNSIDGTVDLWDLEKDTVRI